MREASLSATGFKLLCSKKRTKLSSQILLPLSTNHRAVLLISPLRTKNIRYPKSGQGWSATRFAVGVRNSDELLGYEPPSGVPRLTLAHKKISATINGYGYFWWAGVDSDHRSQVTTDLQSVPFGRSGTYPYMWSWRLESNPQPADYKSAALPIELHQQFF